MNKKTIVIMIVTLILIAIGVTFIISKYEKTEEVSSELNANAKYIWDKVEGPALENDYWLRFRRTFTISEHQKIKDVIAKISVDTRYWLYVNGEIVLREGSLKRGQTKTDIYYDEVDITNYLKNGENTIAILAWHSGIESYSTTPYTKKGLYFEMPFEIVSNEEWKVAKYDAYLHDPEHPNQRLPEANILYDARLSDDNWYKPKYDDSLWENASLIESSSETIHKLIKRDIPLFKNLDLREYENGKAFQDYILEEDRTLEMNLPYNMQFTPYLKIEAEEGKVITIYSDTYDTNGEKSIRARYITKAGKQDFEALQWINGEKVYYEIPRGVKVINLCYRPTGYDTKITGSFECNNDFFNFLWKKASRTLYVNMHDTYMDCPNRERAQWSLDMALSMEQSLYALDTKSYDLYKHGMRTLVGWREGDTLFSIAPNSLSQVQLPVQNLLLISSLNEYYEYTGDIDFIHEVYPAVGQYLRLWSKNEYGYLQCHAYDNLWEWYDSSEELDYKQFEQASYYLACDSFKKLSEALKIEEDIKYFDNILKELKVDFNTYWTDNGYKASETDYIDDRINALAVIAGLADESKYEVITKVLTENYDASPAMEKYVLEALCIMGRQDLAQNRIKTKYFDMVVGENSCSTLWEHWEYGIGTKNHAWAGGVLTIMSKYFAGIEPQEVGYETVLINPKLGNLNEIYAKVPTIQGDIGVNFKKEDDLMTFEIDSPVPALVVIPKEFENLVIKLDGKTIYQDNKARKNRKCNLEKEDNNNLYFNIKKGKYVIDCKNK